MNFLKRLPSDVVDDIIYVSNDELNWIVMCFFLFVYCKAMASSEKSLAAMAYLLGWNMTYSSLSRLYYNYTSRVVIRWTAFGGLDYNYISIFFIKLLDF